MLGMLLVMDRDQLSSLGHGPRLQRGPEALSLLM